MPTRCICPVQRVGLLPKYVCQASGCHTQICVKSTKLINALILIILGDIAENFGNWYPWYPHHKTAFCGLSVWLSVCHVRAFCSNGRKYRHEFFRIRQPHVSPRSCQHLDYMGQPLPPEIFPRMTHPCWHERQRHSKANCGRMVRDSAMVTVESL